MRLLNLGECGLEGDNLVLLVFGGGADGLVWIEFPEGAADFKACGFD